MPAADMSWYETYTYATWLDERLPTEAEWEYMARAGCGNVYCGRGGEARALDQVAWTRVNSFDPETYEPLAHRVRQLEPNAWGFYDMLGNVWEYTGDWHGPYPGTAPRGVKGPTRGLGPAVRGGSYTATPSVDLLPRRARIGPG